MSHDTEPSFAEIAADIAQNHRFQTHKRWQRVFRPGPPGALSTDHPPEWEQDRWRPFLDEGEILLWVGRRLGISLQFLPRAYAFSDRRVLIMGGNGYRFCRSITLTADTKVEVKGGNIIVDRNTGGGVTLAGGFFSAVLSFVPLHVFDDPQDFAAGNFMFVHPPNPTSVAELIRATALGRG